MTELPPSLSPRPPGSAGASASNQAPRVQRAEHGLTSPGVAVVVFAGTLVGLLIDAFTIDSGVIVGVAFVASCLYAALQVRRSDLLAAVLVPPLVFLVLTVGRELIAPESSGGLSTKVLQVASDLATAAPALWAGTALAGVVVAVRWRRGARPDPTV